MKENQIIVLCGKSSSGKDTLASYFKSQGYKFVISHTSRPMRENESEGNPYYFISAKKFKEMLEHNQFIEYREYLSLVGGKPQKWFYGVHQSQIEDLHKYVLVVDLQGLSEIKAKFGKRVKAFYLDVPTPIRTERAMERGSFDEFEWNRRVQDDDNKFHWLKLKELDVNVIPFRWQSVEELYQEILEEL